jgi:hypothetical protein
MLEQRMFGVPCAEPPSATMTSYMPGVSERRSSRTLMLGSLIEGGDNHRELHLEASIGYSVLPLASAVAYRCAL